MGLGGRGRAIGEVIKKQPKKTRKIISPGAACSQNPDR
jgi:hypothetical protein